MKPDYEETKKLMDIDFNKAYDRGFAYIKEQARRLVQIDDSINLFIMSMGTVAFYAAKDIPDPEYVGDPLDPTDVLIRTHSGHPIDYDDLPVDHSGLIDFIENDNDIYHFTGDPLHVHFDGKEVTTKHDWQTIEK